MKILLAEDDPIARRVLEQALRKLGHETQSAADGEVAWQMWKADPLRVIVSDWAMPGVDGLELCRRIRDSGATSYSYFILLTSREASAENQRQAVEAGVDDFLSKPLVVQELWMRLRVAERILRYATQVRQLEAFLPICSYCKKIRDDSNYWQQIESYINSRTGTDFSHSICPDCYTQVVEPQLAKMRGLTDDDPPGDTERSKPNVRRTH